MGLTFLQRNIIDHQFVFVILEKRIGLQSKVIINEGLSGDGKVKMGVPQGSVLGPLLLSCYMLPLEDMLKMYYVTQVIPFFILYSIRTSVNACLVIF